MTSLWWVKKKLMEGLVGNGNIHIDINFDYKNIEKAKNISTGSASVQPKTSSLVLLNIKYSY